jgi:hypothetical protein
MRKSGSFLAAKLFMLELILKRLIFSHGLLPSTMSAVFLLKYPSFSFMEEPL